MGRAKNRVADGANERPEDLARRPLLSQTLDAQGLAAAAGPLGDLRGDPYYEGDSAPKRPAAKGTANAPPPCLDDDSLMDF